MEEAQEAMGSPGRHPTQLAGPRQLSKKCKLSWHLNDKFRLKERESQAEGSASAQGWGRGRWRAWHTQEGKEVYLVWM